MTEQFNKIVGLRLNDVLFEHCENRVEQLNKTYLKEFNFSIQSYIRRLIYEDLNK